MLKIKLNKQRIDLINKFSKEALKFFNIQESENDTIVLVGEKEQFEELLDNIADIISTKGIDEYGELNIIGNQMEKIIDIISNKFL